MLKNYMFSKEVDIKKLKAVPVATNRYDSKVILSTKQGEYTRMLQLEEIVGPALPDDQFVNIDLMYQYDPFRISQDFYGTPSLYWAILAANNLFDVFDLKEGLIIRIPSVITVLGYNGLVVRGDEF